MSEENVEQKTNCFRCDKCGGSPCTVAYDNDVHVRPQMPEACPFGNEVFEWKRVEQDQPVTMKQEIQHRSYLQEFMEFCEKNGIQYYAKGRELVRLQAGSVFVELDDVSHIFRKITIESKRAVLLAQLCQAVHEQS